jgi:hypothetical protein
MIFKSFNSTSLEICGIAKMGQKIEEDEWPCTDLIPYQEHRQFEQRTWECTCKDQEQILHAMVFHLSDGLDIAGQAMAGPWTGFIN